MCVVGVPWVINPGDSFFVGKQLLGDRQKIYLLPRTRDEGIVKRQSWSVEGSIAEGSPGREASVY